MIAFMLHPLLCSTSATSFLLVLRAGRDSLCIGKTSHGHPEPFLLNTLRPDTLSGIIATPKPNAFEPGPKSAWRSWLLLLNGSRDARLPLIITILNSLQPRHRRIAMEPFSGLSVQTLGTTNNHKQLLLQHLPNVRTCFGPGCLFSSVCHVYQWSLGYYPTFHLTLAKGFYLMRTPQLIVLKDNQPELPQTVVDWFAAHSPTG
jgi:hypothetical protein